MTRDTLLTISEASRSLGVSEVTLRQWTDEGKINAFITPGGHRRYSQNELKKFLTAHKKTLGIRELAAELGDMAEVHSDMFRASMAATSRYRKLSDESRQQLANQGRSVLHAVIRYITQPSKRDETIGLARESGRAFGELLAGLGLPLTDSVEAFILHRDPIISCATHLLNRKEALSGRVIDAIPLVVKVMDEALVSLVDAFQKAAHKPDISGGVE